MFVLGAAAGLAAAVSAQSPQPPAVQFVDVTASAGIAFTHNSGRTGQKLMPETLGSGAAFFDADGDGWPDLLLVNGRDWKPGKQKSLHALYRNNRDGTFTDVTRGSGLDVEMYGMGVAAGDYDNDGRDDVYITAIEGDRLFRNEGAFTFRDVTKASGIANANFGTSAAWFDYDKDGRLDLFVANYVTWRRDADLWCSLDGTHKSYCTPEAYKGAASKLYRNVGGGRFADVSRQAGVADPTSKSLGIAVLDYDLDTWPDLLVANDTQPNKLYRNNRNGTFTEEGVAAGVAYSDEGVARAGMGVDAGDYDRSGRPHLVIGNFANETVALYHNEGSKLFVDQAPQSAVGQASLLALTFAAFFFDYDLDGHLDILLANGHIEEQIERVQPKVRYRQPPQLFRNRGGGRFEHVSAAAGKDFAVPLVARGAAHADYDRDGDLDVVITSNHGPARLLRNDGGNRHNWLAVRAVGTKSNRSGIGAIIRLRSASGKQWQAVRSGSSYCSQSDLTQTFGLGPDPRVEALEVEWPSGGRGRVEGIAVNQRITIVEGKGLQKGDAPGTR